MTHVTNALKVPKARLPIEIKLRGGAPRRVEVFVSNHGSRLRNRLAVLSLLTQEEPFIPAQDVMTEEWLLFNRDEVLWVGVSTSQEPDSDELELFDRRFLVKVELDDSTALEGEMLFSPPTTGQRVVDHLNRRERFFFLFQSEQAFVVNKASVAAVIEISEEESEGGRRGED